jgi:triacylglycerol lipase
MARHHVILIPGFFAFAGLGELKYWSGVDTVLKQAFDAYGLSVEVIEIETLPTASIRFRATRVLEAIERVAAADDGPIHLVGHSTGGLDARLAVITSAALAKGAKYRASERVQSIVTLATPHYGTPLAATFGSAMGQPLLRWLAASSIIGLEHGKLPLSGLLKLGKLLVRLDDVFGLKRTVVDQLYAQLLNEFTDDRRHALIRFLRNVSQDRALIVQLTADSLDLFNATTRDPEGIACGSAVTRARRPTWRRVITNSRDAYAHTLYGLFTILWLISSQSDERYLPELNEQQRNALLKGYGRLPDLRDNDGMAPTLSQVWGEVIHATQADHLDVMGQYGDLSWPGIHADWLPSGSGFDAQRFTALWTDIAAFITRKAREG